MKLVHVCCSAAWLGNGDSTNLRSHCVKRRIRDEFWQATGGDVSVRCHEHDSGGERESTFETSCTGWREL